MAKAPRWLFGWADGFTDTWGALPAEPILYFFMLTGLLQIMVFPRSSTGGVTDGGWISGLWKVSGVVSPLLCLVAWYLINKCRGQQRLVGLWVRFAGDFGQATALGTFLLIRLTNSPIDDDAHVYLMHIDVGVLTFVLMLVLRDIWILLRVEESAAHLTRLVQVEPPEGQD
jgi:hypothetical protein